MKNNFKDDIYYDAYIVISGEKTKIRVLTEYNKTYLSGKDAYVTFQVYFGDQVSEMYHTAKKSEIERIEDEKL